MTREAIRLITDQLTILRNAIGSNLNKIQDHETQIHELNMYNVNLTLDVKELEQAELLLRSNGEK